MNESDFYESNAVAMDGTLVRFLYDKEADILEIFFGENEPSTGVELTDHIIFRLNVQTRRPVSLVLLHFSILTETTDYGPRSYPIDKLNEVPDNLRELALKLATRPPVNQYLKISHFQASRTEQIPFTYVESQPSLAAL
jgi:hypothetical protein